MNSHFFTWYADPILVALILMVICGYDLLLHFRWNRKAIYFMLGLVVLSLAVFSPLHQVGMRYLFSAHMTGHILVLLIAAPLFVASIPVHNRYEKSLCRFSAWLSRSPFWGWVAGVGVMWFWHLPFIFHSLFTPMPGGAMANMPMHGWTGSLHIFSLLGAGMLFSWPLINPYLTYRLPPLKSILFLTTACIGCSLLGLLITFSPSGLYTGYLTLNDANMQIIRNSWGITADMDQQMAGLIMWVPCCFIYVGASMVLLLKWFGSEDGHPVNENSQTITV